MKILYFFTTIIMLSVSTNKCSDGQKMDKKTPAIIGDVYVESSTSDEASGTSGYTLYIPVHSEENKDILLESVYFRGQIAKLDRISEGTNTLYIAEFKDSNSSSDIILSSNPLDEMANRAPKVPTKIPFEIGDSECIVSYSHKGDTRYFKIENIRQRFSE